MRITSVAKHGQRHCAIRGPSRGSKTDATPQKRVLRNPNRLVPFHPYVRPLVICSHHSPRSRYDPHSDMVSLRLKKKPEITFHGCSTARSSHIHTRPRPSSRACRGEG